MPGKISNYLRFVPLFLLFCVLLCSCSLHDHEWQDATCTTAKTCSICGHTEGDPLGHQWADATCTAPKTCSVCGETKGNPSKHSWIYATCETPKTCSLCGTTEGEPYGHSFNIGQIAVNPTCQAPGERISYCRRYGCDKTETSVVPVIDHRAGDWQVVEDASTSTLTVKARYCTMCGEELDRKEIRLSDSGGNGSAGGSGTGGNNFNAHNNESQQQTTASYVLNTSTKKFHRPSCRDVPRIASQNYATSSQSRSDLISRGYSPCGHCNP